MIDHAGAMAAIKENGDWYRAHELERQSRAEGDESLAEVWRKRKEKAEAMREKSERGKE